MNSLKYIKSLDGIRAIAILLVIVWHHFGSLLTEDAFNGYGKHISTATSWTWSGVDLFFVLSGFLIGRILIFNKGSNNFLKTFYIRRVLRIFPAFYLVVLGFVIFRYFDFSENFDWLFESPHPIYSYLLYIQNWFMAFDGFGNHWLSVTWSLAVEEQFYLILPFVILFYKKSNIPAIVLGGVIISIIFRATFGPLFEGWLGSYVLLPARMDALLIGVLIAYYHLNGKLLLVLKDSGKTLFYFILLLFVMLMSTIMWGDSEITGGTFNHTFYAIFYGLILIYALISENKLKERILSLKLFSFLSLISYMVYLTHKIFLGFFFQIFLQKDPQIANLHDLTISGLAFISCIAFSTISYYLMEKPLIKIGKKFNY
jgi:peptidoglycan/LPS O-acetylase OafA/YrhL